MEHPGKDGGVESVGNIESLVCLVVATDCNCLPSREGVGGVLKPVNKTVLVTGLFAVCFS